MLLVSSGNSSELLVKATSLLTFTSGVRTPRRQQIAEAGRLRTGHHCGRPPVHGLWHPNIRGSRDHRRDRVSAPVCFLKRSACRRAGPPLAREPGRSSTHTGLGSALRLSPFLFFHLEVGAIFCFPNYCSLVSGFQLAFVKDRTAVINPRVKGVQTHRETRSGGNGLALGDVGSQHRVGSHYFIQLASCFRPGPMLALWEAVTVCEVQTALGVPGSLGIC